MTARTQLTPVQMVRDGGVAEGAGTSIAGLVAAGAYVADPPGPNYVFLVVNNSDSSPHNVIVRAGGSGVIASGAAAVAVPFEQATVGDLTQAVANAATEFIGPFTTDRFTQADGSLSIDFSSGFTGTIWVMAMPYNALAQ